ncbi:MAG: UxaA family hydrolase [Pseudomonadota bacterium]
MSDTYLIRLAEGDNVLVLASSLAAGQTVDVEGARTTLATALTLGHKIAARTIAMGETIWKYNFPIGIATADIAAGEHVHIHNVRSDYTPSYVVPEDAPC